MAQHAQVDAEVLGQRQLARQDGPAVVVEDGQAVDLEVAEVMVEVAEVHRPHLVAVLRRKRHGLRVPRRLGRLGQAVQLAIEGEDAPAGARAEVDTDLLQRRMDAELPEGGILLQPRHGLDGRERLLGRRLVGPVRLVVQAGEVLAHPPPQDSVHGRPADLQVGGDTDLVPAFEMELQHGAPAGKRIRDGVIGREAASGAGWRRLLGQDAADGVMAQLMAEARPADGGDLAEVQRGVFAPEVDDGLANLLRDALMPLALRRWLQATEAGGLEARHIPRKGARVQARRRGALGDGVAKDDDRPDGLVRALPGRVQPQLQLLPVVGRGDAVAFAEGHGVASGPHG